MHLCIVIKQQKHTTMNKEQKKLVRDAALFAIVGHAIIVFIIMYL